MRIQSLLSHDMVISALPPSATALDATRLMVRTHRGSVLVIDGRGRPQGIFTERDLMVRVVAKGHAPRDVVLSEVMSSDLFMASPEQRVTDVRREMRQRHIRHVPVVGGDEVLAVLSMRDLLRADFEETRHDAEALRGYIQGEGIEQ